MDTSGEYRFDEGAIADYDQLKAQALDKLRLSDGFILVCGTWENDDDLNIVVTSGTRKMDPVVFLSIANVEGAKLLKKAVMAATEDDVEEIA